MNVNNVSSWPQLNRIWETGKERNRGIGEKGKEGGETERERERELARGGGAQNGKEWHLPGTVSQGFQESKLIWVLKGGWCSTRRKRQSEHSLQNHSHGSNVLIGNWEKVQSDRSIEKSREGRGREVGTFTSYSCIASNCQLSDLKQHMFIVSRFLWVKLSSLLRVLPGWNCKVSWVCDLFWGCFQCGAIANKSR